MNNDPRLPRAHQILDRVKDGCEYPKDVIRWALRLTGDIRHWGEKPPAYPKKSMARAVEGVEIWG